MSSVSRIQRSLTLEEFLALPEEEPSLEFINGRVEAKVSPQKKHGVIESKITESLNRFAEPTFLGMAIPELRCTYAGRSIVPDVVFLLDAQIGTDEQGEIQNETFVPPDLHVEIISPDQTPRLAREKLVHSTSNGCSLGWLIDPEKKWVDVYRPGQPPETLALDGVLEGEPVLPGYRLPVAEVFGWLKRRRPERPATGVDPA
ncbi:Endonuclease, Uma2 family (restriction endonuclease fold) [Singulisphaera sp. GP187]|uniref:Uma2 family endonuclease n=1 Tax=Singulisphaera sp. GP187 TaxID=1882752 RepID=UPI0009291E19|nr:Uma2 family endonuclease [Singulisphaera sp. GP187]SIO66497.1 Endonuclease, Uma2 family (restriction endonuclease fold) [Singulisphaera sp. GP187]